MVLAGLGVGGVGLYGAVATGRLTVDFGWGRTGRMLGPQVLDIAAPREIVFDVAAGPYLHRTPRAMAAKLQVLERASDMVLAAHHTPLPGGLTATTVETVRFERPQRISFRLVRGPVPDAAESFELEAVDGERTRLVYRGELRVDGWFLGRLWATMVARVWERTVATSLAAIRAEAERLAATRPGR